MKSTRQNKGLENGLLRNRLLKQQHLAAYLANPRVCEHCHSPILPRPGERVYYVKIRKFCGHSCSFAFHCAAGRMKPGRRKTVVKPCRGCGQPLHNNSRKFCLACLGAKRLVIPTRTKADADGRTIRNHASAVAADRERTCVHCGYDKFAEVAHVRPVADFPGDATLAEINHPKNLVMLCPNCHWEFDHGLLSLGTA